MMPDRDSVLLRLFQLTGDSLTDQFIRHYQAGQSLDLQQARSVLAQLSQSLSCGWNRERIVQLAIARARTHVLGISPEDTKENPFSNRVRTDHGGSMRCV